LATNAGGTVIKRIGDELLISFRSVAEAEIFFSAVEKSDALRENYRFKMAADYGTSYHFRFEPTLKDDPYGLVVDRCARLARLGRAGATLCSYAYVAQVPKRDTFLELGKFALRGFKEAQMVYFRVGAGKVSEEFLKPLIDRLNREASNSTGYRWIARKFTPDFFQVSTTSRARPFLLREFLNIPKLPETAAEFHKRGYDDRRKCIGYLVEWEGSFNSYEINHGEITVKVETEPGSVFNEVHLQMMPSFGELIKALVKGQQLRFRGIITDVSVYVTLDYVDIDVVQRRHERAD